ncbi:hypothetical protein Avbf_02801 [Armadillidium vulgare]|nr:hypothetical protein Avbf_02801 [Armadillidium vulgare]
MTSYTCSWRDEHSAPFAWHTRSQMDLTLESPPETPALNCSTLTTPIGGNKELIKEILDNNCNTSEFTHASKAPFFWHYTPQPDLRPPDPPDLVLASLNNPESSPNFNKNIQFNHIVVRGPEERRSFLGWFRGALSSITGTCIPIHSGNNSERTMLHPSSPFIHPELRPPHVIAKGAKISSLSVAHPKRKKTESEESIFRLSKDATLKSECPSTETTFTNDVTSDKGSSVPSEFEGSKRDSQNLNRSLLSNRNSLMYGTFTEENLEEEISNENLFGPFSPISSNNLNGSYPRKKSLSLSKYNFVRKEDSGCEKLSVSEFSSPRNEISGTCDSDEDLPLINLSTNNQI